MNLDSVFFVVNIRSRQGMSDGISCFFYKNRTALMDMFSTTQYQQPSYAIKNSGVSAKQYFEYVKNKFSPAIWENMRGL